MKNRNSDQSEAEKEELDRHGKVGNVAQDGHHAVALTSDVPGRNRNRLVSHMKSRERSVGTILLTIFFAGGALICLVTVLALAFPGSFLESIWRLKPEAQVQFLQIGRGTSMALMTAIGAACGLSAFGLAQNAQWGRKLAIAVLVLNVIGDSLNALLRHDLRTLIGIPIGALMIWYLLRRKRARI
jgi:hypothetical protein